MSYLFILKTTLLLFQNRRRFVIVQEVLLEKEAKAFIQLKYTARDLHSLIRVEFLEISADTLEMTKK